MIHCPRFLRFHRAEKWDPTDLNETSWSSANQTVERRWRTTGRCRWNRHTPKATTQKFAQTEHRKRQTSLSHQKPETKDMNSEWVMLCKVNRKKFLTLLKTIAVLYRTLLFGSTSKPPDKLRSKNWVQFTCEIHQDRCPTMRGREGLGPHEDNFTTIGFTWFKSEPVKKQVAQLNSD